MSEIRDLLKSFPLFSDLSDGDLADIERIVKKKKFGKNEIILYQFDPGDSLYIVSKGKVKVVLYSKDGKEVLLSNLGPGEFFGEMSLLDGLPRSASVVAIEDSEAIILNRRDFLELIRNHPEIALKILTELSKRLRSADQKIGSLILMDVYGRVARVLVELAEKEGKRVKDDIVIETRLRQQDIANMVGASRETVSRVLKDFVQNGFISIDGKKIIIHNADLSIGRDI